MHFIHEDNRILAVDEQDNFLGEALFTVVAEDRWTADFVGVDSKYRGQGIAGKLVEELVNRARAAGVKITPI